MVTKQQLERLAQGFDTSEDFDAVMAFYDAQEMQPCLRGRRLLEMGTSAGTVTRHLLPLADRLDIVEGSETGIRRTEERIGTQDNLRYHHALWEEFEPDQAYSDIVCVRGLEHVEEPVELLARMKEWITQDGRIHIIVPNAHSLHRYAMVRTGELPHLNALRDRDNQVGHQRVYTKEELEADVTDAGLVIPHSTGFFLKTLSTEKMGEITMDPKHPLVRSCYEAGKVCPEIGTQLYVVGEKR